MAPIPYNRMAKALGSKADNWTVKYGFLKPVVASRIPILCVKALPTTFHVGDALQLLPAAPQNAASASAAHTNGANASKPSSKRKRGAASGAADQGKGKGAGGKGAVDTKPAKGAVKSLQYTGSSQATKIVDRCPVELTRLKSRHSGTPLWKAFASLWMM